MKTTTAIIIIALTIIIGFTVCVSCAKIEPEELVQEIYTEGYEVSSLHITQYTTDTRISRYYVAIRNDFHSAVVEVNEEMFASVAVGEIVEVEVTATHEDGDVDLDFVILGLAE